MRACELMCWCAQTETDFSITKRFPVSRCQVDYMEDSEEYFQRQASHRQSRRRFRKINQRGERQTIIDTVEHYPVSKPPLPPGYHTVCNK